MVRKCNEIKLEHFPQYRSLNGDSLRDDEAEIGAEATKPPPPTEDEAAFWRLPLMAS